MILMGEAYDKERCEQRNCLSDQPKTARVSGGSWALALTTLAAAPMLERWRISVV